jgi:hypothetical protein
MFTKMSPSTAARAPSMHLGPAVDPLTDPLPVRVEAARHLADEALARLQPEDRVVAPPSHAGMLALTILDGWLSLWLSNFQPDSHRMASDLRGRYKI